MKFKYTLLLCITPAVFVLDQLTKLAVMRWIEIGERIPVVPGLFDLVHFRNTGAAFGMLSDSHAGFRVPFFYAVALIAAVVMALLYRSLRGDERLMPVALSLVFGGIAGNLLDRIRLGSVVDFLSFHIGDAALDLSALGGPRRWALEWPAFNVADSAITVAMALLVIAALRRRAP